MTYATVLLEEKEPGIFLLTINREKALNALAPEVLDDIAAAVAYLASPSAGYITGCVLHVNGGMYMG